jgi:glycosyltransferase involved in cell wall biosynthesis
MSKLRVSVAMCTYNGATFLEAQLQSIANQTQLPDELVVCDDGSTDSTYQLLETFAQNARFNVKIYRNDQPLRVTKNFEKALNLCSGDVLFLCDQDDLWRSDKIAVVLKEFDNSSAIQMVYSDAELINERGDLIGKRQWEVLRLYPVQLKQWKEGYATDLMLGGNRVTGCMLAVKKHFVNQLLPFPTHIPGYIHDGWIGFVGSVLGVIQLCNEPLTMYRQHPNQQIGIRTNEGIERVSLKQRFMRPRSEKLIPLIEKRDQLALLYEATKLVVADSPNLSKVTQKLHYLETRCSLPPNRIARVVPIIKHLVNGNYHRYADQEANFLGGFLAALGDFIE